MQTLGKDNKPILIIIEMLFICNLHLCEGCSNRDQNVSRLPEECKGKTLKLSDSVVKTLFCSYFYIGV